MHFSNHTIAGSLLFAGMTIFIIGLNVSEELYPGYSVSENYISDLGATCRSGECQVFQPSSMIFNSCVFIAGLCAVTASYFVWLESKTRLFPSLLALAGAGAMGVGLFPEYNLMVLYPFALWALGFGGYLLNPCEETTSMG